MEVTRNRRYSVFGGGDLARGFILGERVQIVPPTSSTGLVTGLAPDVHVYRVVDHRPQETKEGEIPKGWDRVLIGEYVLVSYKLDHFRMGDVEVAIFPDGQAISTLQLAAEDHD